MTNINEFINWIVYSGGALLIVSWAFDKFPKFTALPASTKRLANLVASLVLALGFYAAILYVPHSVMSALDPWFKIVAGVVAVYSGQQAVHSLTKPETKK